MLEIPDELTAEDKIKVIKQPAQQPRKSAANDANRPAIKSTISQKLLPNQQIN